MALLCEVEDCDNLAAWSSPKYGTLCHKHMREVRCTCQDDPDGRGVADPLCPEHGDVRDTSYDPRIKGGTIS